MSQPTGFVYGNKELQKKLESLATDGKRNKIARPAMREASGQIRKAAKAKAPTLSGSLKKSIKNVVRTGKNGVYAVIGPAAGFATELDGKVNDPLKYAHLVENGTTNAPPHPFLRPAFDSIDSEAIIARRMRQELEKEASRGAKKR